MEETHWDIKTIPKDKIGFTYCITNLKNGRKYYGRKAFYHKKTKKPLKGYKRKRISYIESDWKTYTGSSDSLNQDISKLGKESFSFEILECHETKTKLNYAELELIVINQCLRNPAMFYNKSLNGKYFTGKV